MWRIQSLFCIKAFIHFKLKKTEIRIKFVRSFCDITLLVLKRIYLRRTLLLPKEFKDASPCVAVISNREGSL